MTRPRLPNLSKSCGEPCAMEWCPTCLYEAVNHDERSYLPIDWDAAWHRSHRDDLGVNSDDFGRSTNLDHDLEYLTADLP